MRCALCVLPVLLLALSGCKEGGAKRAPLSAGASAPEAAQSASHDGQPVQEGEAPEQTLLFSRFDFGLLDVDRAGAAPERDYLSENGEMIFADLSEGGRTVRAQVAFAPREEVSVSYDGPADIEFFEDGGAAPFQTLHLEYVAVRIFLVADANFDGFDDFLVVSNLGANNADYQIFLYDGEAGQFGPCNEFGYTWPEFYPAAQTVLSYIHMSAFESAFIFSRWKDGKLLPVAEADIDRRGADLGGSDSGSIVPIRLTTWEDGVKVEELAAIPENFPSLPPDEQKAIVENYERICKKMRSFVE